jgi:hypothetical protein
MGERIGAYRAIVERQGGRRPFERLRRRLEDNIKTDFQEVRLEGMDWIDLAQDRNRWLAVVNAVINLQVPQHAGNFLSR